MRVRSNWPLAVFQLISFAVTIGCADLRPKHLGSEKPIGTAVSIKAPLGLPPVPMPQENPATVDTIELGRKLFYETRLSKDTSLSCASCHNPQMDFTDGRRHSIGVGGMVGVRNAPTLINAAYTPVQFWDGRAPSLEEQAAGPIANPIEMNQSHDVSVRKLEAVPGYKSDFARAFGPGPITIGKVEKALASFERTLLSGNSPFDRYQYGGDTKAMSPSAIRGLKIFRDQNKGNCIGCHSIEDNYALFTDGKFHNIGVGVNDEGELVDLGRYNETKNEADKGAFKTPSLRNIAQTGPYMHDGSIPTLKGVVDFYAGGGNSNPHLDPKIKNIGLTGQERSDLVAFLQALTGDPPANAGPPPALHQIVGMR